MICTFMHLHSGEPQKIILPYLPLFTFLFFFNSLFLIRFDNEDIKAFRDTKSCSTSLFPYKAERPLPDYRRSALGEARWRSPSRYGGRERRFFSGSIFICLSFCLYFCLALCLSFFLILCLSIFVTVCLFVYLSTRLSFFQSLSGFISICLPINLSVNLPVCLSVSTSTFLSFFFSLSFSFCLY